MAEIRCPLCENEDEPCLYCAVAQYRKDHPPANKENVYRKTMQIEELQTKYLNEGKLDAALALANFLTSVKFTKRLVLMAYVNRHKNARFRN